MQQPSAVFPAGSRLPIRFLYPIASGRDTLGTRVLVQTMGALVSDSCIVVRPYTQVRGRVLVSRGGRRFGRRGEIRIQFDSLEVRRGEWVPIEAVLDSLEYAPRRDLTESGTLYGRRVSIGKRLLPVGLMEASGVGTVPVVLLGGYWLSRSGPRAQILAGEVGGLRLVEPLTLPVETCERPSRNAELTQVPELPQFVPRSANKSGKPWDVINLIFFGTGPELDTAFKRAGWVLAQHRSMASLGKGVLAALAGRAAKSAPVSTEYFQGREQDVAFELPGPNARIRHHARVWLLDSLALVWVGAATKDIGISLTKRTHTISPEVDLERDRVVRDLEAAGCADLVQYVSLPGAVTRARTPEGQGILSDGRAAMVRVRSCSRDST